MADIAKVIKGLECIAEIGECDCNNCEYAEDGSPAKWYSCQKRFAADAIALLKAQEPRVLTLEEVLSSTEPMWLEAGEYCRWAMYLRDDEAYGVTFLTYHRTSDLYVTRISDADKVWKSDYGKTWRCWSAKPTDEQREKEKWHE